MDQNNKVSLGCGTLILIALIVLIFGNHGGQELAPQIHELKASIQQQQGRINDLEKKIDQQSRNIEALLRETRSAHPETH